jgi:AraC family transcriptional activator of pobA
MFIIKNNEICLAMNTNQFFHFHTITEYHRAAGLPKPLNPLISLVHMDDLNRPLAESTFSLIYDFYSISMKRVKNAKFKYGQQAQSFSKLFKAQTSLSPMRFRESFN